MASAEMESACALGTTLGLIAVFTFVVFLVCMVFVRMDRVSVMLDGQELSARQRFVQLVVLSTGHANQMQVACALMDGKETIVQQRSALAAQMECARAVCVCVPMVSVVPLAQLTCAEPMAAMATESALVGDVNATKDSMAETVLWSNALIAKDHIVIALMVLALAKAVGPEKIARLLNATMIALDMVCATMERAFVTQDGLELIVRQRNVPDNPVETLVVEMVVVIRSVSNACAPMAGLRRTAQKNLVQMTARKMACAMTESACAQLDFREQIAQRAPA